MNECLISWPGTRVYTGLQVRLPLVYKELRASALTLYYHISRKSSWFVEVVSKKKSGVSPMCHFTEPAKMFMRK